VRRQWRQAREAFELDWVRFHTTRKTVASLVNEEADTATATKTLGNASEQVVREHYLAKAKQSPDVRAILDALAPLMEDEDE
jgi:integrase